LPVAGATTANENAATWPGTTVLPRSTANTIGAAGWQLNEKATRIRLADGMAYLFQEAELAVISSCTNVRPDPGRADPCRAGRVGTIILLLPPMFSSRLIQLRKAQRHTQQGLADAAQIHVNQINCYEAGTAQPTLEALVRLAKALHLSLDMLVFDEAERGPSDDLALQFEAVSHMPEEERRIIKALLDGMIIKYQTKQMVGNLSS
jgi:transcriptional regulator with XRE-family HTH domain